MRYSQMRSMDISNGTGIGAALFVQGCPLHCENCFNKDTWDFTGGKEFTEDIESDFLSTCGQEYISRISILGGEPLCKPNVDCVFQLLRKIKSNYPNKAIWVFTEYEYEELLQNNKQFTTICFADVVVCGRYVDKLKNQKLKFKGSYNQRCIDVLKTITQKDISKPVLMDFDLEQQLNKR